MEKPDIFDVLATSFSGLLIRKFYLKANSFIRKVFVIRLFSFKLFIIFVVIFHLPSVKAAELVDLFRYIENQEAHQLKELAGKYDRDAMRGVFTLYEPLFYDESGEEVTDIQTNYGSVKTVKGVPVYADTFATVMHCVSQKTAKKKVLKKTSSQQVLEFLLGKQDSKEKEKGNQMDKYPISKELSGLYSRRRTQAMQEFSAKAWDLIAQAPSVWGEKADRFNEFLDKVRADERSESNIELGIVENLESLLDPVLVALFCDSEDVLKAINRCDTLYAISTSENAAFVVHRCRYICNYRYRMQDNEGQPLCLLGLLDVETKSLSKLLHCHDYLYKKFYGYIFNDINNRWSLDSIFYHDSLERSSCCYIPYFFESLFSKETTDTYKEHEQQYPATLRLWQSCKKPSFMIDLVEEEEEKIEEGCEPQDILYKLLMGLNKSENPASASAEVY